MNEIILSFNKYFAAILDSEINSLQNSQGIGSELLHRNDTVPMFYDKISNPQNKILVVGYFPSFYQNMEKEIVLLFSDNEILSLNNLLNSNSLKKKSIIDNLIKFQTILKGREKSDTVRRLKYFSAIDNFVVKDLKLDTSMWEHYDLYSFRFNNTKIVDKLFSKRRRKNNLIIEQYYQKSLEMLANFICTNNFIAVIVSNAPVSKILQDHKMIKKANNKSYYFIDNCNTPIFLSKEFIGGGLKVTERQELTENIKLAINV
jgi:hypothetical protein